MVIGKQKFPQFYSTTMVLEIIIFEFCIATLFYFYHVPLVRLLSMEFIIILSFCINKSTVYKKSCEVIQRIKTYIE